MNLRMDYGIFLLCKIYQMDNRYLQHTLAGNLVVSQCNLANMNKMVMVHLLCILHIDHMVMEYMDLLVDDQQVDHLEVLIYV